jgi:hypothetical protein
MINNGIVAFCDSPKLVSQLYDIGWQNGKIGPRRSDMHADHANAAALAVFVCARPPNPEEMKPAPPIIIPINPTSSALVNVHAMTHALPFAAEW